MTTSAAPEIESDPLPVRVASLSPSRAADFKACPLLYRFRVVDRLPSKPSPAAARGTLVHAVLERLFDLPAPERTLDAARALVPSQWERMLEVEPELAGLLAGDEAPTEEAWFAQAATLLDTWFGLEDPTRLEPADRELYVETSVDSELGPLLLRGIIDRLDVRSDGALRIVDYKTGRSPGEQFERPALFQLRFYALVLWRLHGVVPAMLQIVYLGDRTILRYEPDEADLLATERTVGALWAAIHEATESGDWQPHPSRVCDWCDFKGLCPAWGGTPPPLPANAEQGAPDPPPAPAPSE